MRDEASLRQSASSTASATPSVTSSVTPSGTSGLDTPEPVSAPTPVPTDTTLQESGPRASDPLVGKVLMDRVRIIRAIARGGMGRVYLGEQTRMNRRCAVKVLDPRFAGAMDAREFAQRFLLEASVASKVSHPNVVTIFDYGESSEGCFIAMEYLEGRSLSEELTRAGRLSPERSVHVAQQVARALREAHALGVVHRDVKPGNIFLVKQDDDEDFAKVLDFGLVQESKSTDRREQASDAIMGSPRYMAPEQVQGKEVDARADIYSLGAVLYAMLTGHPPFERRTELATMMAHVSDPPPEMASVAPDLVLPPGLEAVVMRCLAKSPDARWASMEELIAAIQSPYAAAATAASVSAAVAVLPAADAALHRSNDRSRGGRTTLVAGGLVVAVALAGGALFVRTRGGDPVPTASATAASPPAPTPSPSPAPPARPKVSVTLHLQTDPPGAKVNEEGETMCASTPCDVVYTGDAAEGSTEHLLAFLLPGYKLERRVAKATGGALVVKLTKAR